MHDIKPGDNWRMGYPMPCGQNWLPAGQQKPVPQTQPAKNSGKHNVLYLVDEHVVTKGGDEPVDRHSKTTIKQRYAFYYCQSNLTNLNVGQEPITITLHEKIADPKKNPCFKWEGFMFDIPTGDVNFRCGIVEGAATASPAALDGHGTGDGKTLIDRPVGFGASYDGVVPIGPIVQVRRDDLYRVVGAHTKNGHGVAWHLAYYITKDTPSLPSEKIKIMPFNMEPEGEQPQPHEKDEFEVATDQYDACMDSNIGDDVETVQGVPAWGGDTFSTIDPFQTAVAQYVDELPEESEA